MRLRLDHALCKGLKFFVSGDDPTKNLALRSFKATSFEFDGIYPGHNRNLVRFAGGTENITFANNRNLGLTGPNLTVMARVKWGSSGVGQEAIIECNQNAGSPNGFSLYFSDGDFSSEGFRLGVRKTGTFTSVGSNDGSVPITEAVLKAKSAVLCGTYQSRTKTLTLFYNGRFVSSLTDTAQTWDVDGNDPVIIGNKSDGAIPLHGDIEWAAAFNRVLSRGEILQWAQDHAWPFSEEYDLVPNTGGRTVSSTVGVRVIGTRTGVARTLITEIEVLSDLEGDVEGGGETQPTTRTLKSVVGINQSIALSVPTLQRLRSVVGIESSASLTKLKNAATVVGVRSKVTRKINGRADWLNAGRYRR